MDIVTFGVGSSWSRVIKVKKHIRRLDTDPRKRGSFNSMDWQIHSHEQWLRSSKKSIYQFQIIQDQTLVIHYEKYNKSANSDM